MLIRGLENLEAFFGKGFNFVSAKSPLRRAESRFAEPRCSLQRERVVTFCVVQKVTKKHAPTHKNLPPATFCTSEQQLFPYFLLDTKSRTKKLLPHSGQHTPRAFRRHRRTFPGRFATLYSRFRRMVFLPRQAYARSRKTALLMPSIISAVTFSKMSS